MASAVKCAYHKPAELLEPDLPTPEPTGTVHNYRYDTYRVGWGGGYLKELPNGRFQATHWYGAVGIGDEVVFSTKDGDKWRDWRARVIDVAWNTDPRDLWCAILEQLPESRN